MEKRRFIFGTYNTAANGWTLNPWTFPEPEYQAKFLEVPGGMPLDVSTILTDGEPSYGSRTLTVPMESSEGSRMERDARIREMVNALDGRRVDIVFPDYPQYYATGRVQVKKEYNDPAHCAVVVSAICDPWLYSKAERMYTLTAATVKQVAALTNSGRRVAIPELTVTGDNADVLLEFGTVSVALGAGTTILPDLVLPHGDTLLTYSGTGKLQIKYREAVL